MLFKVVALSLFALLSIGFSAAETTPCKGKDGHVVQFDRHHCNRAAEQLANKKAIAVCGLCVVSLKDIKTGKLVAPLHDMNPALFSKQINSILDGCKSNKRMRRAAPMNSKDQKSHPNTKYDIQMNLDVAKTNVTC